MGLEKYPVDSVLRNLEEVKKDYDFEFLCSYIGTIDKKLVPHIFCNKGCKWFGKCQGNYKFCDMYRNRWLQEMSDEERDKVISELNLQMLRATWTG